MSHAPARWAGVSRLAEVLLTQEDNRLGAGYWNELPDFGWNGRWPTPLHQRIILDMDYGYGESQYTVQQEGAAYNGHFDHAVWLSSSRLSVQDQFGWIHVKERS